MFNNWLISDIEEAARKSGDFYIYLGSCADLNMATALFRSMLLENWGSGARRIMEACQEQGVEEPT